MTFNHKENGNATATANGHVNGSAIPNGVAKENGNHHDKEKEKEKEKDKVFGLGSLSRKHHGSKSMSRKSFGFLGGKYNGEGKSNSSQTTDDSNTAVEGETGPPTPEKHTKSTKDRFSFSGLGRKKSNLMNT